MSNGQLFCDLAYAALRREETDLKDLGGKKSGAALSILVAREEALAFIIAKEALRKPEYPRVMSECSYQDRGKVDLCFVDEGGQPFASFELKIVTWDEGWKAALMDIGKHLNPLNRIKNARDGHQCYNVLLLISPEDRAKIEFEEKTRGVLGGVISNLVFFTSKAIELNGLISSDPKFQRKARAWKYLRVIVLKGEYVTAAR